MTKLKKFVGRVVGIIGVVCITRAAILGMHAFSKYYTPKKQEDDWDDQKEDDKKAIEKCWPDFEDDEDNDEDCLDIFEDEDIPDNKSKKEPDLAPKAPPAKTPIEKSRFKERQVSTL